MGIFRQTLCARLYNLVRFLHRRELPKGASKTIKRSSLSLSPQNPGNSAHRERERGDTIRNFFSNHKMVPDNKLRLPKVPLGAQKYGPLRDPSVTFPFQFFPFSLILKNIIILFWIPLSYQINFIASKRFVLAAFSKSFDFVWCMSWTPHVKTLHKSCLQLENCCLRKTTRRD